MIIFGLGANLGDPSARLAEAVAMLGGAVRIEAVSSVYRTAPVGYVDQPDFFNLVLAGISHRSPEELLAVALRVERALGRARTFRNAPRTIDIDLLAHGSDRIDSADLVLPHPRLHERAFVLAPLAEILPDWRHPVLDRTASELLLALGELDGIERLGPLGSVGG